MRILALTALLALGACTQGTPPTAPPSGPVPVVFNASAGARPGDLVSLQGALFGPSPEVWLDSPARRLPIENSVDGIWVAVRIPQDAPGALAVRIRNGALTSAPVCLNQARPLHLDALQLCPGGAFRIFGRNLLLPGSTPVVTVEGRNAALTLGESDETMLVAVAPAGLEPTPHAVIRVDNGNGLGPVVLDRAIDIVAGASGDPFACGVGWTAAFAPLAERVIPAQVTADGIADDAPAIQEAIQKAADAGGGTVLLPEGTCRTTRTLSMKSRVVLQGAGKDKTTLRYEKSNYPVWASGFDLIGVRNLTLSNGGTDVEGPLIKGNRRVCLQNVRFDLQVSQQMYLSDNRNIVITGCDFLQGESLKHQGPYVLSGSAGLVFTHNTTLWKDGAPSFQGSHDAYLAHNTWTRDAVNQNHQPIITTHSCVIDFCYRVAVVGNTFSVAHGPFTNRDRNDGETLLTEGGGGYRTENLGSVDAATPDTLSDPANTINVHPFQKESIPENYGVAIVDGRGAGQTRRVVAYESKTLTVDRPWDVLPDRTSRYATFVWGLEKSTLKGNTLKGNPRGIWLYQTAIRDVDILGNTLEEGGGIYLRTWQAVASKEFTPIYNVRIAGNTISNTTGIWVSHIGSVYVAKDARPFGIGQIGIEIRDNALTANPENLDLIGEDYARGEGCFLLLKNEIGRYEAPALPLFLGTIYERNRLANCDVAFRFGTGAAGTTLSGNTTTNCKAAWTDTPAFSGQPGAQKTGIR